MRSFVENIAAIFPKGYLHIPENTISAPFPCIWGRYFYDSTSCEMFAVDCSYSTTHCPKVVSGVFLYYILVSSTYVLREILRIFSFFGMRTNEAAAALAGLGFAAELSFDAVCADVIYWVCRIEDSFETMGLGAVGG